MLRIYGSMQCPDCRDCKANLDANQIPYEFIDINESLHNLAEFLSLRDKLPVFDHCKEIGDIGLPALMREDGSVFLDWEGFLTKNGLPILSREEMEEGHSCSLDRKGC